MTSIRETFTRLKEMDQAALIGYVTVGYPSLKETLKLATAIIEGEVDIIELGVPFSDPIADGVTIQKASQRSLAKGTAPTDAFTVAQEIHANYETPLVLMTYFNPVFRLGLSKTVDMARKSGISGFIIPDLPVEESQDYKRECRDSNIDTIFLASPSTSPERLKMIIHQTSGFIYLISRYGVTGFAALSQTTLSMIKEYQAVLAGSIPLAVGFGISKPQHVKQIVKAGADGAIVASAFVKIVEENSTNVTLAAKKVRALSEALKKACKKNHP